MWSEALQTRVEHEESGHKPKTLNRRKREERDWLGPGMALLPPHHERNDAIPSSAGTVIHPHDSEPAVRPSVTRQTVCEPFLLSTCAIMSHLRRNIHGLVCVAPRHSIFA